MCGGGQGTWGLGPQPAQASGDTETYPGHRSVSSSLGEEASGIRMLGDGTESRVEETALAARARMEAPLSPGPWAGPVKEPSRSTPGCTPAV